MLRTMVFMLDMTGMVMRRMMTMTMGVLRLFHQIDIIEKEKD